MSYNIDNWKTKKLENFVINLSDLNSLHNETSFKSNSEITFELDAEVGEITGKIEENELKVSHISLYGEGSGHCMSTFLEDILRKSKGTLEAILVWESGDSVERLIVNNGEIKREDML